MKTMKRTLSILLAVMLLACMMAVPASADGYSIEITDATHKQYEAYQIFEGRLETVEGLTVLSDIEWGDGVNGTALLAALKADTSALKSYFSADTTAKEVAETLTNAPFTEVNHTHLDLFATMASAHLSANKTGSYSGDKYTISDLEAGYYLVRAVEDAGAENVSYTRYMLQVVKDVKVAPKTETIPTIVKTVSKSKDTGYTEAVSATISRDVYFKLVGGLSSQIGDYPSYKYIIEDTMGAGLTLTNFDHEINKDKVNYDPDPDINNYDFQIHIHNAFDDETTEAGAETWEELPEAIRPIVEREGQKITFTFPDIKAFIKQITTMDATAGDKIEIIYKATLNTSAVIADVDNALKNDPGVDGAQHKNTNGAYVKYSAQPNQGASGPMGQTKVDTADVYTYQVNIEKQNPEGALLPGAKFILYHMPSGSSSKRLNVQLEKLSDGVYQVEQVVENKDGVGNTEDDCTEMETNGGKLTILGLGVATFQLEETVAPQGYNKLDSAAEVVVVDKLSDAAQTLVKVVNYKGSTLPETGGIGTTVFYIAGGLMVAAAAAVLLLRKRENG